MAPPVDADAPDPLSRVPHAPRIILFDWRVTLVDIMDTVCQATKVIAAKRTGITSLQQS